MAWWKRNKDKVEPTAEKRSVPSGLWRKCDECDAILETNKVQDSAMVCPSCGFHFPMATVDRIALMLDAGSFDERDLGVSPCDALEFRDSKRYADRLRSAARTVGPGDAFRGGLARIEGEEVAVGFFVFEFMGGSMGSVVGEKIARLFERALERRVPAIVFSASGGARMQEGILSLMQMAKTTAALGRLRASGVPYISVLLHPTTGGVAASFAMLGDVILAEPKALIGFAGPRVIEQTIRQKLPAGFQRSEFLLDHGMLDAIVERHQLKSQLARLVRLLRPKALAGEVASAGTAELPPLREVRTVESVEIPTGPTQAAPPTASGATSGRAPRAARTSSTPSLSVVPPPPAPTSAKGAGDDEAPRRASGVAQST